MENTERILLLVLAVVVMLVAICALMVFLFDFSRDRKYIKFQLEQAMDREEYHYWKRELRILYLTLIPGISRNRARKLVPRKSEK